MKLVDANILLYAVNIDADHHERSRRWLDDALSGSATVGFAWNVLLAFLRLSTRTGLFAHPLSTDQAAESVGAWLSSGPAVVVEPTVDHARILHGLIRHVGTGGNLVSDAHLAALAIEHKGVVVSFDNDFDRFDGVRWETPGQ